MEIAFVLAAIIIFHVGSMSIALWKANQGLIHHPHVMPLAQALPVQGETFRKLIADMSACADIPVPDVFVYRSQLPNAFISAIPLRPELFLSDESLEEANENKMPLDAFTQLIGHELAHIKLHHKLYHAIIMYFDQSTSLWLRPFKKACRASLQKLELEADKEGSLIAKQYLTQATSAN